MKPTLIHYGQQTIAAGSKSFAAASRLFDVDTRRSVLMLYAWCRHCDDVIDDQQLGFAAARTDSRTAPERLHQLIAETNRAYSRAPMREPAFAAFQYVTQTHRIPRELALAHLQGFAMDVEQTCYNTFDDTLRYCYHVAGVVGLMMARVMGVHEAAALDRACDLGLAFQLTNIARDIVEDAHAGRCYLPSRWLEEEGIGVDALTHPASRDRLARLAQLLVAHAEPYYASACIGLGALPLRSAWAIASAHGVYRQIGLNVSAAGANAWRRRQGTSRAGKIGLLLKGAAMALSSRFQSEEPRDPALWQRPQR